MHDEACLTPVGLGRAFEGKYGDGTVTFAIAGSTCIDHSSIGYLAAFNLSCGGTDHQPR